MFNVHNQAAAEIWDYLYQDTGKSDPTEDLGKVIARVRETLPLTTGQFTDHDLEAMVEHSARHYYADHPDFMNPRVAGWWNNFTPKN